MGERKSSSRIPGFHNLSAEGRLERIKEFASLSDPEISSLKKESSLSLKDALTMVENVISTMPLPFCIAPNFLINGKDSCWIRMDQPTKDLIRNPR